MTMPHATIVCPPAIQKLFSRIRGLNSAEGFEKGLSFQPKLDDVLLTTGSKSGTTWVQQIMHGLRSGGNMDFDDVDAIIPFVEYFYDHGEGDIEFIQPFAPPRFFKTHIAYELTPKGFEKCIFVTRDPKDAATSFYHFYRNWIFEGDEISLDEFVEWMVIQDGIPDTQPANAHQLRHLISWYPHRKDENVLWLHYEDLKADLTQCVRLIADFLDLGVDNPELLKLVENQASIEFMKKHRSKFDAHEIKAVRNEVMGLPRDHGIKNNDGRVRKGQVNEGVKSLSSEMNHRMDMKWKQFVEPVTGHGSYEKMRAVINEELGREFTPFLSEI